MNSLKRKSDKSTQCPLCKIPDLYWSYSPQLKRKIIVNKDHERHRCEEEDLRPGVCRYCKATNLVWRIGESNITDKRGLKGEKYELIEEYGLQHTCRAFVQYQKDLKEAIRMNYAWEKAHVYKIEDDTVCSRCKGSRFRLLKIPKYCLPKIECPSPGYDKYAVLCKWCHGIGTYTLANKKNYLKRLRKKYWPFKWGKHKWAKVESGI